MKRKRTLPIRGEAVQSRCPMGSFSLLTPAVEDRGDVIQFDAINRAIKKAISDNAYYRYMARGRENGHALEDWVAAEREVLGL